MKEEVEKVVSELKNQVISELAGGAGSSQVVCGNSEVQVKSEYDSARDCLDSDSELK